MTVMAKYFASLALIAAIALAALLVAGCVVGDGKRDLTQEPPLQPCALYPDDVSKCWLPWDGHIVQTCGSEDTVTTKLYFDRPDIPDSMRVNVMDLGDLLIDSLRSRDEFSDTTIVCDQGACRDLFVDLEIGHYEYWHPLKKTGGGYLKFRDTTGTVDQGLIDFDDVRKEACQ